MREIIIKIIIAAICIIVLIGIASTKYYVDKEIQKDIIKESLRELKEEQNDTK